MPPWDDEAKGNIKSLEDGIQNCQTLVLIFGDTSGKDFVEKQWQHYYSIRHENAKSNPARVAALIYILPDDKKPLPTIVDELCHYWIIGDKPAPPWAHQDEAKRFYACDDLETAVNRIIEKLGT